LKIARGILQDADGILGLASHPLGFAILLCLPVAECVADRFLDVADNLLDESLDAIPLDDRNSSVKTAGGNTVSYGARRG